MSGNSSLNSNKVLLPGSNDTIRRYAIRLATGQGYRIVVEQRKQFADAWRVVGDCKIISNEELQAILKLKEE